MCFSDSVKKFSVAATMEGGDGGPYNRCTIEEVYGDYEGRRTGIIQALTTGLFCFFFSLIFILFLISFKVFSCNDFNLALNFCFCVPDVEEFYKRCDPGEELSYFMFISHSFSSYILRCMEFYACIHL